MSAHDLAGRVALITGGGSGIGRAVVSLFAEAGATVVFTDLHAPAEPPAGANVIFVRADATVEADAAAAVEQTLHAHGRLDVLVNNVGGFGAGDNTGPIEEIELEAWDNTVRQCLSTCMLGMKHALPPMTAAKRGAIINIASLAGIRVTRYASYAYHAAKAGVVHLSEAAAVLYAPQGIRVNVVAPGLTLTPTIEATMSPETQTTVAAEFHPSGRMIRPSEIAEACLWARVRPLIPASPASSSPWTAAGRHAEPNTRNFAWASVSTPGRL